MLIVYGVCITKPEILQVVIFSDQLFFNEELRLANTLDVEILLKGCSDT